MKQCIIFLLAVFVSIWAHAQEANVAYKVDHYNYPSNSNLKIKTNCEMADIVIQKGTSNKVEITCTYSAKHTDKALATRELSRHNIRVRKTLNEIYISNYFTIVSGENEPQAKLKIKFEINIPDGVNLDIQNNFGSCTIIGLPLKGSIHQDFGKVDIQNSKGNVVLKGNLMEVALRKFNGAMEVRSKSGNVVVNKMEGTLLFIENKNATIQLNEISNDVNVKLVVSNCEVQCSKIDYSQHSLDIKSYKEAIQQNSNLVIEHKGDYYSIQSLKTKPGFIIQSTFTKIKL